MAWRFYNSSGAQITATASITGDDVGLDTGNFDNNLSGADTTSQAALETIDDIQINRRAVIAEVQNYDTHGGGATSGSWETRVLNTEIYDPHSLVTISSNQFTLQAGTYEIFWSAPAYLVDAHVSRLYDVTAAAEVREGQSARSGSGGGTETHSIGWERVTIGAANVYRIEHRVGTTVASNGYGVRNNLASGIKNIYTVVEIHQVA